MRRILFPLLVGLLVLGVVLGAFAGYLITSNPPPRQDSPGWLRVKSMPGARGEFAAGVVEAQPGGPRLCPGTPCPERLVYAVGGLSGPLAKVLDRVQVFDPANAWRDGPPLPEARHHLAAAGLGDTLYVTGGTPDKRGLEPHANVWVLRPGRTSFERLADMPEGRVAHAMVAVNKKLYVVAGRGPSSSVLIFDPAKGWSKGAAMPGPRDHVAAVAVQNKIYVIGGRDSSVSRRVDIYDTATDSWSEGVPLPDAISAGAAAALDDGLIHLVGGEDPRMLGGRVYDLHLAFDPIGSVWLEGPKPLLAVHGGAYADVTGKLLVIGGSRRQGTFSIFGWTGLVQVFDPQQIGGGLSPTPSPNPTPSPVPTGPAPTGPTPTGGLPG
ncbi:MAG TPA: kelch repeat-containing protein [Actinomycetota bacterium]|nr:kelch repeat-containing protein [Actinomycetota bacterium]